MTEGLPSPTGCRHKTQIFSSVPSHHISLPLRSTVHHPPPLSPTTEPRSAAVCLARHRQHVYSQYNSVFTTPASPFPRSVPRHPSVTHPQNRSESLVLAVSHPQPVRYDSAIALHLMPVFCPARPLPLHPSPFPSNTPRKFLSQPPPPHQGG